MVQKEKLSIASSQAAPCPCGCSPCEETTCSLDCIIRPRYFCGQLLSEADLNAGLAWNQNKFRLSRRREGWGVVCGLEVSCGAQPGLVTISPGYAVDCCGDDIVVCAETTLDINKLLQQPPAQCDPATGKSRVSVGKTVRAGDWVIVDVSIAYAEENIIPTTTLGRPACGQAAACEYSRAKESYTLNAVEVIRVTKDELSKPLDEARLQEESVKRHVIDIDGLGVDEVRGNSPWLRLKSPDPNQATLYQWVRDFIACRKSVLDLNLDVGMPLTDIRQKLGAWHAAHPAYQFSYLDDFYTTTEDSDEWLDKNIIQFSMEGQNTSPIAEFLFLSMQDCLHHFLEKGCAACTNESVRLARVWLNSTVSQGKLSYSVNRISGIPPFRREEGPYMLPAPSGCVNLGEVIWRNPRDAAMKLAEYGVQLDWHPGEYVSLNDFDEVYEYFNPPNFWLVPGRTYVPLIYRDRFGNLHVVGRRLANTYPTIAPGAGEKQ
jgi:hypothetical protein